MKNSSILLGAIISQIPVLCHADVRQRDLSCNIGLSSKFNPDGSRIPVVIHTTRTDALDTFTITGLNVSPDSAAATPQTILTEMTVSFPRTVSAPQYENACVLSERDGRVFDCNIASAFGENGRFRLSARYLDGHFDEYDLENDNTSRNTTVVAFGADLSILNTTTAAYGIRNVLNFNFNFRIYHTGSPVIAYHSVAQFYDYGDSSAPTCVENTGAPMPPLPPFKR